ncbi:MAG: hydrolase TatD [Epulopiscium sp. Nele67-Bin004]|nr:MAG: hydrolase TatD [Epulopiscium sp. Nele67-Bin004]
MRFFDSHAHYDDERFDEDRESLLNYIKEQGVDYVMNVGADMQGIKDGIELAKKYPYIYASVGIHPHYVAQLNPSDLEVLEELAKQPKVKAIGEIGLDYYYDNSPRDVQKEWFRLQLGLAKKLDMPVIIHSRDACQDTFDILKDENITNGVIHCFSGSKELALEYIKRGFYIGVGGSLTFKNARKTVEVVENIPLEKILIETDAPYLSPVPHRGKRNDSSYLLHVVEKIANIQNVDPVQVAEVTLENAKLLYNI